jgi:hypothetical protein
MAPCRQARLPEGLAALHLGHLTMRIARRSIRFLESTQNRRQPEMLGRIRAPDEHRVLGELGP